MKEERMYTENEIEQIIALVFDKVHSELVSFQRADEEMAKEKSFKYVKENNEESLIDAKTHLYCVDRLTRILHRMKDHYPASLYINQLDDHQ